MISEPELVGEERPPFGDAELPGPRAGEPAAAETVSDGDGVPAPRPRPAWQWALGSALVASVVWAGGLYAYETRDPDLGGYRTSRNLCTETGLKALSTAIGKVESRTPAGREHKALSMASCYVSLQPAKAPEPAKDGGYEVSPPGVSLSYMLHKKTDPGPEFEAVLGVWTVYGDDEIKLEPVDGLGERAYFVVGEANDDVPSLHVLDGQAVFTLEVSPGGPSGPDDETPPQDLSGIRPFMIEDMKALMAKVQS